MEKRIKRYSEGDLNEFRLLIENKLQKASQQILHLENQIEEINESSDNSYDPDDDSVAGYDFEMLSNMLSRQKKYANDLQEALLRIKNKTYGICSVTNELIEKKRLLAVPITTKSIAGKQLLARQANIKGRTKTPKHKEKVVISKVKKKNVKKVERKEEVDLDSFPAIPNETELNMVDLDFSGIDGDFEDQ